MAYATAAPGDAIQPAEPPVTPRRAAPPASESPPADGPGNDDGAVVEAKAAEEVEEEGDQDEDEDEPKLKYHRLTGSLSSVYRNGDATSCFLVSGDKMVLRRVDLRSTANEVQILGTHNGNIVSRLQEDPDRLTVSERLVDSVLPTFTNVSRPFGYDYCGFCFPIPDSFAQLQISSLRFLPASDGPTSSPARGPTDPGVASPRTPRQPVLPSTPSNNIFIATSSIDGHVCVASLVDPKDVTLRNFSRPVQAVALSPDFKSDRTYLSGGLAGNLILTTGGKSGVSANANTNSAAAAASGWLSSMGLSANNGRDRILHSGEGAISVIKWSLSGKFVVWANEHGIKIMRTGTKLQSGDADYAWSRIAHVDKPGRPQWEEMAGVWRPRAEWIDEARLEPDEEEVRPAPANGNGVRAASPPKGAAAALRGGG